MNPRLSVSAVTQIILCTIMCNCRAQRTQALSLAVSHDNRWGSMHDYLTAPTIEDAARAACMALHLDFRRVAADGVFHRLTIDGRQKDGSLCLFTDSFGGIAKNFKTGEQRLFFVDGQEGVSDAELRQQSLLGITRRQNSN
jgi:hypothetical protein